MSECADTEMTDVLPEFVRGRLTGAERERVAAHIAACPSCAAEAAILGAAQRAFAAATPAVDVARIVGALPAPPALGRPALVRGRPARRRWLAVPTASWRIAATVGTLALGAVSIGVVQSLMRGGQSESAAVVAPRVPAENAATADESAGLSAGGTFTDLSEDDMRTLLNDLNDIEAIPAAEPQPAVPGLRTATAPQ